MNNEGTVILVATEALTDSIVDWAVGRAGQAAVTLVKLTADRDTVELPPTWQVLCAKDLGSAERLHRDILAFLSTAGEHRLADGRTFDQMFRLDGDYSLWWVGPASHRHQDKAVYAALRAVWMLARAFEQVTVDEVLVATARPSVAAALASKAARENCPCAFAPSLAGPAPDPWRGRLRWGLMAMAWVAAFPWLMLIRSLLARVLAGRRRLPKDRRRRPAIAMTGTFPRHVRTESDRPEVWYWKELSTALADRCPLLRRHYLLHTATGPYGSYRMVAGVLHTGWPLLRRMKDLAPIEQIQCPLFVFARAAVGQVAAMGRYARLERRSDFRSSLVFQGADVAGLYVLLIRRNVARMAAWAVSVASVARSLRALGDVRMLVVNEEMYGLGMRDIAAARKLGIPTLGVQHGAIFPMHMPYTAPPAQLAGTPVCDRFAVYGPFAKEVITDLGAYPPERVWITGGPRFDPLVNTPPDRAAARQRLGFDPDKKIVLITTNFFPWFQDVARSVFDACKDRGDVLVCLKTHPRDFPLSVYEQLARQVGAANVRLFDDRFDDLMAACNVLIGGFSTTVMEAILLGRTTICVNFSDEEYRYPYVADGGSLPARSDEEMRIALDKALSGASDAELAAGRERFLERHLGPTAKGQAANALADAIADFLDARPTGK